MQLLLDAGALLIEYWWSAAIAGGGGRGGGGVCKVGAILAEIRAID